MQHFNIITRRGFLDRSLKVGMAAALSTLTDIPLVLKQALAACPPGNIGNGKKLLFIFLRGANDSLNSMIPVQDPSYLTSRPLPYTDAMGKYIPNIGIPTDTTDYTAVGDCFDPTLYTTDNNVPASRVARVATDPTYSYANIIRLGNGFAGLHPSLKFLAPVYNAGHLALIHRVGYPKQSRSHFDSQNYWETGVPNNNLTSDGIFYRTMIESGLANCAPLTGVSIQSSLPLILRGSAAPMTNLTDPNRYNLLGIPNTAGDIKAELALRAANLYPFPDKQNRGLLSLQYQNLVNTLQVFDGINFNESGNTFVDSVPTDNDYPYYLFPTTDAKNGGYAGHANDKAKFVVDNSYGSPYTFFGYLKAAALILNKTDAIIAGTQLDGFDTHGDEGGAIFSYDVNGKPQPGYHAKLQRTIGWAMYALKQYFTVHGDKAKWNDTIVVTLSEFGRTSKQNDTLGTDHAESGVMFVAGGAVKGYGTTNASGVFACHNSTGTVPWVTGPSGSMFLSGNYLKRAVDYRSVLGEIIRDHLGATQAQLDRIIPGYTVTGEKLQNGGTSTIDSTPITGELGIV